MPHSQLVPEVLGEQKLGPGAQHDYNHTDPQLLAPLQRFPDTMPCLCSAHGLHFRTDHETALVDLFWKIGW